MRPSDKADGEGAVVLSDAVDGDDGSAMGEACSEAAAPAMAKERPNRQ